MDVGVALFGLLVVTAGWVVTFMLGSKRDRELEITKIRLGHVNDQLSKFYGQVYGLLLENDRVRRLVQEQFGRQVVFEGGGSLPPDEEKLWVHSLENYFLPNNRKIVNLIIGNTHLWSENNVPPSFLRFLDYAIGFECLHKQFREIGRDYGFHMVESFPEEFRREIVQKVTKLKNDQWELVNNSSQ